MALRVVDLADGYESELVPSVVSVVGIKDFEKIISALDIMNGYVTLSVAPSLVSSVNLSYNGISQYSSNNDFAISGNQVLINGYNLENLIEIGGVIRLIYQ